MARSTRTDYAKVKIWLPNMIADMEGPISAIAFELFAAIDDPEKRLAILKLMQERHETILKRSAERANDAAKGVA